MHTHLVRPSRLEPAFHHCRAAQRFGTEWHGTEAAWTGPWCAPGGGC
jgi:hypothetical protein